MAATESQTLATELLAQLGVEPSALGGDLVVHTPITGDEIARVDRDTAESTDAAITRAASAFAAWQTVPAPRRGGRMQVIVHESEAA